MAKILIIDDEPNISLVLKIVFTERGHEVTAVGDGLSGMEKLRNEQKPDIVLVDLCLPRLNGREVIEQMNGDNELSKIPRFILSGSVPNSRECPARESYNDFIAKPFDLFDVVEKVESYC